jgi:hypothetical protein
MGQANRNKVVRKFVFKRALKEPLFPTEPYYVIEYNIFPAELDGKWVILCEHGAARPPLQYKTRGDALEAITRRAAPRDIKYYRIKEVNP